MRKLMHYSKYVIISTAEISSDIILYKRILIFCNVTVSQDLNFQPSFSSSYCVLLFLFFLLLFLVLYRFSFMLIPLLLIRTQMIKVYHQDRSLFAESLNILFCFFVFFFWIRFHFYLIIYPGGFLVLSFHALIHLSFSFS